MGHRFLSDEWFDAVEGTAAGAPDPAYRPLNLVVTGGPDGERHAHLIGDVVRRGHSPEAGATLTVTWSAAYPPMVHGPVRGLLQSIVDERTSVDGDFEVLAALVERDGVMLKGLARRLKPLTDPPPKDYYSLGVGTDGATDQGQADIDRLGLGEYARRLDEDGFVVVPPEVTGLTPEFVDGLLERSLDIVAERNGVRPDVVTGETHRNVHVPSIYFFMFEDPRYEQLLLNEQMLAIAQTQVGADALASSSSLFVKGPADTPPTGPLQLVLHADASGIFPEPLPVEAQSINVTWCLTDYSQELGGTCFVAGSHRERRMPQGLEGTDRLVTPEIPKGSMMMWVGNTWHGSHQRTVPGLRVGLVQGLSRPYMARSPYWLDVPEASLLRNPPRFAKLMGLSSLAGYSQEGPNMLALNRAEAANRRRAQRLQLSSV